VPTLYEVIGVKRKPTEGISFNLSRYFCGPKTAILDLHRLPAVKRVR